MRSRRSTVRRHREMKFMRIFRQSIRARRDGKTKWYGDAIGRKIGRVRLRAATHRPGTKARKTMQGRSHAKTPTWSQQVRVACRRGDHVRFLISGPGRLL